MILVMLEEGLKIMKKHRFATFDAPPIRTFIASVVGVLLLVVLADIKRIIEGTVKSSESASWPLANVLRGIIKPDYISSENKSTTGNLLSTLDN